jgi:hypothetical protein
MFLHVGQSPFGFFGSVATEPIERLAFFSYIVNSWTGGVAAPIRRKSRSILNGADGVVVQATQL